MPTNGLTKKTEVFIGAAWIDLSADVVQSLSIHFGVDANGPLDLLANTGHCQFNLRNDAQPGKLLGRYSVSNVANKIAGWTFGIPFRLTLTFLGVDYVRFRGKIRIINPDTGHIGRRQVEIVAYDVMRDLAEADLRQLSIPVNQSESQVVAAILDAVAAESQPIARSLDLGVDVLPYALYDIGGDTKAMTALTKVSQTSFYFMAVKSDGTFIGLNRHTYALGTNRYTFDGDFDELEIPSDAEEVFSIVRATTHPVTIGTSATVLYALTGTPPSVQPGQTLIIWGNYNDSSNAQRLIGGLAFEPTGGPPPGVSGTDYAANSAVDGSGSNLTGSISVTITAFATTAKFQITNNAAVPVYLVTPGGATLLQIRGKAVRDLGPQTFESTSSTSGKPFAMDLSYQSDPNIGQNAADYVYAQRNATRFAYQVNAVKFRANRSTAKMVAALSAQPGDQVIITEPVNGLTLVSAIIQSVTLDENEGVLDCRFGLAPAAPFKSWQVEVVGANEVEQTIVVGF